MAFVEGAGSRVRGERPETQASWAERLRLLKKRTADSVTLACRIDVQLNKPSRPQGLEDQRDPALRRRRSRRSCSAARPTGTSHAPPRRYGQVEEWPGSPPVVSEATRR